MSILQVVNDLRVSLTAEQLRDAKEILGESLFGLFDKAIKSKSEADAAGRIKVFMDAAKEDFVKMLRVRKILNPEQREIILRLMDGE